MSLIIPFVAVSGLGLATAVAHRKRGKFIQDQESALARRVDADRGRYMPYSNVQDMAERLDVESYRLTRDTRGAPIYLVRYKGLHNEVLQYHPPEANFA